MFGQKALDEKFIRICIELSKEALKKGDKPFGCVITKGNKVISTAINESNKKINHHAEILALNKAQEALGNADLSGCTLYTNCEPCPMCAFMIREFKIERVVFSLSSLYMGGYSKWPILQDTELTQFKTFFSPPPKVTANILEEEAKSVFAKTQLWMFSSKVKKERMLRAFAELVLDKNKKELNSIMKKLNVTREEVIQAYVNYDLDIGSYKNEIYTSLPMRVAIYLHYLLPQSWHQERQETILELMEYVKPRTLADIGFGAPTKYVKDYVLKNQVSLTLIDLYESAFISAQAILEGWSSIWKKKVSFKKYNMDHENYVGDFDCYIFQDSIEHTKRPTRYLSKLVSKSPSQSTFILSLPICEKIPAHNIEWKTDKEAINWLNKCGLNVTHSRKIHVNPKVDLFADSHIGLHNLVVLCTKA